VESEKQIASELGVRYVVEGGIQKAGDHIRVSAQLIDGETGAHLWAERYDRDSADYLKMQEEITYQIANTLEIALVKVESERSWRDHPANPDAVDLRLRADAILMGPATAKLNAEARQLYLRALELDPKNVAALIGLGYTYLEDISDDRVTGAALIETMNRADDVVARILSINPGSPSAYQIRSHVLAYRGGNDYRGELLPAIAAAETSLEIDSNRPGTLAWLARLYTKAGHPERTAPLIEQAIRLDPRSPWLSSRFYVLGMAHLQMAQYDKAIDTFQKCVLLSPRKVICWGGLTGSYFAAGRSAEALSTLAQWREVAASEGNFNLDYSTDKDVLAIRVQLALVRLGRWPYAIELWTRLTNSGTNAWKALHQFQVDEKLPQTGQLDEATLARLGITSPESASASK
jgi:tetratricopeptide (TPR) repeat protein